jgi:hypothetical protein
MTLSSRSSKLKAPQVSSVIRPTCDPEKQRICANLSCDQVSCDQTENKSSNISCAPTCDKLWDPIHFRQARSPLINKWQTMRMVHNQWRHVTLVKG